MNRAGVALLEVVVAVAILATAGLSLSAHVIGLSDRMRFVWFIEDEMGAAEDLLTRYALLSSRELGLRLGVRAAPPYLIYVDRPAPELFRIGVAAESAPDVELLATLVYKRALPAGGRAR